MSNGKSKYQTFVETSKSTMGLIREFTLILLVVSIILWPEWIMQVLDRAGVSEVGPFKLRNQIMLAQENAQEADQMIERLQTELNESKKSIEELKSQPNLNPEVRQKINNATERINKTYESSSLVRSTIQNNIAVQSDIIDKFEPAPELSRDSWAVVAGADRTEESARHEMNRFKELGFNKVQIYLREEWYRTVIVFDNNEIARENLPRIKKEFSNSAYVVNLSNWCPRAIEKDRGILYECR